MQLEAKKYLYDVEQAAVRILQFTEGKTFASYAAEPMLRSAAAR